MTSRQIELMKHNVQRVGHPGKPRRKLWKVIRTFFFVILVCFFIGFIFSHKVIYSQKSIVEGFTHLPVISQIKDLLVGDKIKLEGAGDDRINFLLLGQGGVGHQGPYLTDTIIVTSVKPSTGQAAMLSIPRDFSILIPGYGFRKINEANSIGEINEYKGGGAGYTAKILEDVLGIPIHYWIRVDFNGFITVIDKLGGVEICVERAFTDNQYPTDDELTQTLTFKQGCQKMDGKRALQFARSRHGNNNEGSDFARSKRQQKIILAVKDKIFSWRTALSPNLVYNIVEAVRNHVQTNVEVWQVSNFMKLAKKIDLDNVTQKSLDSSTNGYLKNWITGEGAYVLVPRTGNYNEIRRLVKNIFEVNKIEKQTAKVVVLNGTDVTGLAQAVADDLVMYGFRILDINNSPIKDYEKTVIYNMHNQAEKKEALKMLKQQLNANISNNLLFQFDDYFYPEDQLVIVPDKQDVDFLIVLGLDQAKKMVGEGRLEIESESE